MSPASDDHSLTNLIRQAVWGQSSARAQARCSGL